MDVSTPPSLDSLVPKRKLSSVNKSTCLWSEVSIIKNTDKKHQYLLNKTSHFKEQFSTYNLT